MPSEDAGSRKLTWFFQGMGLAALVLVAVYSMGGLEFQHESETALGPVTALAFNPVVPTPGIRSRGKLVNESRMMEIPIVICVPGQILKLFQ